MMERRTRNVLLIILAASALLRLGAALLLGNQVIELPGTADQISYHNLALRLLEGHGFTFGRAWWPATAAGEPTAHWSYLYTGYLALVYALFGPSPLAPRLLQAVLAGVLHPLLAYLLGRKAFGPGVGLLAAGLTGVYAYFIYYSASLMTEPFYILAILSSLYFAIEIAGHGQQQEALGQRMRPPGWLAIGLGLSLAAAGLLRQVFLLFIPFLFLWVLLSNRKLWVSLALSALVVVAAILPFTLYNYVRFDRFVLLNTNAGFAFYWGNHPVYGTDFVPILPPETYRAMIPEEIRGLDEASLDQELLARALGFIAAEPGRYLLLSIDRIPAYFMFWPSSDSGTLSNIARVGSFGLLWPFMLYGLLLWLRRSWGGRGEFLASPALLLALFGMVYSGIHILTWALVRYRLPVDAVLLIFAGLAVADLAARIPAMKRKSRPQAAGRKSNFIENET